MSEKKFTYNARSDKELRSRVKLLGQLLGNVLIKHEDPRIFKSVEKLRKGFIQLRKHEDPAKRDKFISHIELSHLKLLNR